MFNVFTDGYGNIIGAYVGHLSTNVHVITDNITEFYTLASKIANMPKKPGFDTVLKLVPKASVDDPLSYYYDYIPIPAENLSDEELKEMFQQEVVDSITISEKPSITKEGYHLVPHVNGTTIVWDFVSDNPEDEEEDIPPISDGTYLKPYRFIEGMSVSMGMWYTDGDNIWEAIADGIPSSFNDTNFFDIV